MKAERRYSIILEHSAEMLLENVPMAQIEAFWDANDTRYFGLRMEDEHSAHTRVIVTDEVPDEEEVELNCLWRMESHADSLFCCGH